jgi:hypothetical protein
VLTPLFLVWHGAEQGIYNQFLVLYTVYALWKCFFRPLIDLRVHGFFSTMALQFDEKPSGTTPPSTRTYDRLEHDRDWNPKMDDVEVSSSEINPGIAVSRNDKETERLDPVTELKQRLSLWGRFKLPSKKDSEIDYSIDPNYPEDERESIILDSSSIDDAKIFS